MTLLFVILIIIASLVLGLIVLIQNPKGGGLAGNIAGFSTQFMGVKQTTDILEKGTWLFAGIIAVLTIISPMFMSTTSGGGGNIQKINSSAPAQPNPANTTTFPGAATTPATDTNKK